MIKSLARVKGEKRFGPQTPRRWGLGNPAEETFCRPNQEIKERSALLLYYFKMIVYPYNPVFLGSKPT